MSSSADSSPSCVQRAYLYLARDVETAGPPYSVDELQLMAFDPDEVSRIVGLQPTMAWQRGAPHPNRPGPRQFSAWEYSPAPVRTYRSEEVVARLLDDVEPYATGIAEACKSLGMRAGVAVVIEMTARRDHQDLDITTAAVGYSAETIGRLARLSLALEHDQYLYVDE
ncbi:DUF4279 domain-containing protein [Micromonospora sp. WMMD729]|uniref:DUF4279 domain-containing protein n=1 Tax=Micromonospora sp. WMMD729 TaxID=3404127 RepID=UPI003BF5B975